MWSNPSRITWIAGGLLGLLWFTLYLTTVSPTVNFIDSGELIAAAHEPGIAHPPGYPLYVLMGYVVSHLLWGEVAWRMNVLSAFWGAMSVGAFFFLVLRVTEYIEASRNRHDTAPAPRKRSRSRSRQEEAGAPAGQKAVELSTVMWIRLGAAAAGASLLAASATFWSRTAQAKMYTLHYFFVIVLLLLAVCYRRAWEDGDQKQSRRILLALALTLGLSLANHLMTFLLVPSLLLLVVGGSDWRARLLFAIRQWRTGLPALLLPLMLYLYLPLRSAQGPLMNWGSPDNWGDFWRHIRGWQYGAYVLVDVGHSIEAVRDYAAGQWGWLTWPILPASLAAAYLVARRRPVIFAATALLALFTLLFAVVYGISEIEPYLVPVYIAMALWLATAPASMTSKTSERRSPDPTSSREQRRRLALYVTLGLGVAALASAVIIYPRENHSQDGLAEQFVTNTFSSLEPGSILITNYWDFYAPTYYLQDPSIRDLRPDLTVIDMSLLKYPWYLGQLSKKYPWLVENSRDIAGPFSIEQRKWVNGEPFDAARLNSLYFGLLSSFVDRNYDQHPAYVLFLPCDDPRCESNQVAPKYARRQVGLASRLLRDPASSTEVPEPHYDLAGITHDKVPLDDFSRPNSLMYVSAYAALGQYYQSLKQPDKAQRMFSMASEVEAALKGR